VDLVEELNWIDRDPGTDNAVATGVQHPGWDQMELEDPLVGDDGVAGVGAAVGADHHVRPLGERVSDLPLALVAPLAANDDRRRHRRPPVRARTTAREPVARGPCPTISQGWV